MNMFGKRAPPISAIALHKNSFKAIEMEFNAAAAADWVLVFLESLDDAVTIEELNDLDCGECQILFVAPDKVEKMSDALQRHYRFPVFLDKDRMISAAYNLEDIGGKASFIIGEQGIIKHIRVDQFGTRRNFGELI